MRFCQEHNIVFMNIWFFTESPIFLLSGRSNETRGCHALPTHCHPVPIPARLPTAVKTQKGPIEKELSIQRAVGEYWTTWEDEKPLSQTAIVAKHRSPLLTLTACIWGQPSKLASASLWQKIHPDEECLTVNYLEETAHWGFPETRKRSARCEMRSCICDLALEMQKSAIITSTGTAQLDGLSISAENMQNSRKGKNKK